MADISCTGTESNDLFKIGLTTQRLFSEKNRQWINAIYQIPVGVMISSASDQSVMVINPALEDILGISETLITGTAFSPTFFELGGRISYPGRADLDPETFTRHLVTPGRLNVRDVEVIIHQPGGSRRYVLMSSSAVLDQNRQAMAVASVFHDITERKEKELRDHEIKVGLEEALRHKSRDLKDMNDMLETIYNTSSESIWVCNGEGQVISINRASEELLGIRAENVIGKGIDVLVEEGFMDQSVTQSVLKSRRQESMIQEALKTGKTLLVTGTPVFDEDGGISMVIVNERDLTQLNQLQEELQQVKEEKLRIKAALTQASLSEFQGQEMIAHSSEMQEVLVTCRKLAAMNVSNILILGESGTGKSLTAKFIHTCNDTHTGPFVKINCAAVPEPLLEAELFGYEPGAFTGAKDQGKMGLVEMAQDGTLFLDEIGDLPLPLQAKLLHCLEEKEIMHLGGLTPIPINCNIIAATNVNLAARVDRKEFRQDLYFRLNTFPVTIPPLRSRPEDILELTLFFLNKYNQEYKLSRWISSLELKRLQAHSFPGNVRELKNSIKKAVVMAEKNSLDQIVGPVEKPETVIVPVAYDSHLRTEGKGFNDRVAGFEKTLLSSALECCNTTRELAGYLDMTQSQVVRKLKKHDLSHLLKLNRRKKKRRH
ncbi:MAG: sigma 54-interacting transcriptional regulator [Desulfobacterales bacterium]|nr:sigma 54-interacting transcriptional regulator [Desulfobacterales bacterium]